jgi:hypothetical protein
MSAVGAEAPVLDEGQEKKKSKGKVGSTNCPRASLSYRSHMGLRVVILSIFLLPY